MPVPEMKCCVGWEAAKQHGTDSEGWQQLLWVHEDAPKDVVIGADLAPINFCPWCGKNIKDMPNA
jgi:hypothetical protein